MADIVIEDFEPLFLRLAEDYGVTGYDDRAIYPGILTDVHRAIPKGEGRYVDIEVPDAAVGDCDYAYLTDCRDLLSFATLVPQDLLSETGVAQVIREFLQLIIQSVDDQTDLLAVYLEDTELYEPEYPYYKVVMTRAREIIGCPATYFLAEFETYMVGDSDSESE